MAQNIRTLKVAKEIQRCVSEIIRGRGMAFFDGAMVSVSGVEISPDLSVSRIYVSVFPSEKAEKAMTILQDNIRTIRGEMGASIGKQIRVTPEINFYLDSSLDYVEHIEQLLKQ